MVSFDKLLQTLGAFTEDDWKKCRQFLEDHYHSKDKPELALFDFIAERKFSLADSSCFTKANFFELLYPGQSCFLEDEEESNAEKRRKQDVRLRKRVSHFLKKIEAFLAHDAIWEDAFLKEVYLLIALEKRQASELLVKRSQKFEISNEDDEQQLNFNARVLLQQFLHEYLSNSRKPSGKPQHLLESYHNANQSFLLFQMRLLLFGKNRNMTKGNAVVFPHEEEILKMAEAYQAENRHIRFLYQTFHYDQNNSDDPKELEALVKQFDELSQVAPVIANAYLRVLANYAIEGYRKDKKTYQPILLNIYQSGFEKDLLAPRGVIDHTLFLNIITRIVAELEEENLPDQKKADLEQFFQRFRNKYEDKLPLDERERVMNLTRAHRFRINGRYVSALQELKGFDGAPADYQLRYRSLRLVCIFECLLDDDSFESLFDDQVKTFRNYLDRTKEVSANRLVDYRNFVRYIERLKRYTFDINLRKKLTALKAEITRERTVYKVWLLGKIKDLEKNGRP